MENSQKNTDCYFFYYSTCKKANFCPFRHEPAALGCETVCRYWQQGNCIDEHCNFRHMELKKNRKIIACYWETQPGGCRKPHCSFMHKNVRTIAGNPIHPMKVSDLPTKPVNQEWSNRQEETKYDGSSTESDQGRGSSEAGSFVGSPAVDPLIVKFEEESDSESVPSPVKPQPRVPYCKTYEEIRLEEIQAESAAYYSYAADDAASRPEVAGGKMKTVRTSKRVSPYPKITKEKNGEEAAAEVAATKLNFKVLSLEEIRRRKKHKAQIEEEKPLLPEVIPPSKGPKEQEQREDFLKDAIKSLAELKAERASRGVKRSMEEDEDEESPENRRVKCKVTETLSPTKVPPVRLRRSPKRLTSSACNLEERSNQSRITDNNLKGEFLEKSQSEVEEESSSLQSRKSEIQVRLCDSSTDEDQIQPEKEEKKSVGTDTTDDSAARTSRVSYDSLLNINDDDYLSLDTTSADILKDIDALLTDKEEGTV